MQTTNALVTYTDLTTMGLPPIGTPPTGNQIATKQFIVNNYYVDQSVSPFSTYSSNRCPIYQSIIPLSPLPYSYTLYYDYDDSLPTVIGFTVPQDACTAVNSFTVYSSSSSISIGTVLYYNLYGTIQIQANPNSTPSQNYYSINNNIIQFSDNCTVGSISACAPPDALFYIENSSLDIIITGINVNGVALTGVTGTGFPLVTGDAVNGYSNQLGTQNVDIFYSNSTYGQRIEGNDSNLAFYCNDTVGVGSHTTQFGGAYVGAGTFQIYAYDGGC